MKRIVFIIILVSLIVPSKAQQLIYNLNKTNGLPTNHVYCAIVDQNGYLWMGTEDGVLRYNGYEIKRFGYDDGLPNVDVWSLYKDSEGRIIVLSIGRGLGYIKNNKYHPFVIKNIDINKYNIFPTQLITRNDTTFFWNLGGKNWLKGLLGYIVDDTVFFKDLDTVNLVNLNILHNLPHYGFVTIDSTIIGYKITPNKIYDATLLCEKIFPTIDNSKHFSSFSFKNNVIRYLRGGKSIRLINIKNCTVKDIYFSKGTSQRAEYVYVNGDDAYIISQDSIYVYHEPSTNIKAYAINHSNNIKGIAGRSVSYFSVDRFWGQVITTYDNGVFLNLFNTNKNQFKKIDINLAQLKYLAKYGDSISLWWNHTTKEITTIKNKRVIGKRRIKGINDINACQQYDKDTFIISSTKEVFFYSALTNFYLPLYTSSKYITYHDYKKEFKPSQEHARDNFIKVKNLFSLVYPNEYFFASNDFNGLHYIPDIFSDTIKLCHVDDRRYKGLLYLKETNSILAYNQDEILIYNKEDKSKKVIPYKYLSKNGVRRIEKVFEDAYGNIYIQDFNNLYHVNIINNNIKLVFEHNNLQNAIINFDDNILTIANSFGVAQYKTTVNGEAILLNTFLNTKGLFYSEVINMQVSSKSILIGTNNGTYEIDLTNEISASNETEVRLIATYASGEFRCNNDDTIIVPQGDRNLSFDVINPKGYGELRLRYRFNDSSKWLNTSGKVINLLTLKAGNYYNLQIQAYDDAWNGGIMQLRVYIKPYWWQTNMGKVIIAFSILLILILLVLIAIVITRRIVSKSNERKNQQRNLELKSIYSQINPHFIFNTLSTALYFVKRNENKNAYEHISQFSELLRAYLKASRNKYISIEEEVENLKNYLQLQLSRFEEKFVYNINIDDRIDASKALIPSLILQPVVENALNHGLFHKNGLGNLAIEFRQGKTKNQIICIVDDDGIGREKSKKLRTDASKKADSYGTILIKELVDTFNKYEPIQIEIEYIDKQLPNTGTTVVITINNTENGNNRNNS